MKKIITGSLVSVSLMMLMSGCGQSIPGMNTKTQFNECATINKKLKEVDLFTAKVNSMSAFHLEEAASAIPKTEITTSNNKKTMLKDAARKKRSLLAESQKYGCAPYKK